MKKKIISVLVVSILCLTLSGCKKEPHELVAENVYKIIKHDSFLTEKEYSRYIKDLDDWAVGEAYDELVQVPDSLRVIDYEESTEKPEETEIPEVDEYGDSPDIGSYETIEEKEQRQEEEAKGIDVTIDVDGVNIYACFQDVDLEEFSDFYLFESEDYLNEENSEGGVVDQSKTWDAELTRRFNPNKEHNVKNAVCYIGYGYYTLKYGNTEFRYYLAVKCNKEGKVEKYIQNYLGT